MKRRFSLLLALCLAAVLATPAAAAEHTVVKRSLPDTTVIGVYGSYRSEGTSTTPASGDTTLNENGDGTITLPDGTEVTLDGDEADAGLRVVIIPVTAQSDRAAYDWAAGQVTALDAAPVVYYVMFYRGEQAVTPEKPVKLTLTMTGSFDKTALYFMTGEGRPQQDKTAAVTTTTVTFNAAESGYYMLLKVTGTSHRPPWHRPSGTGTGGTADPTGTVPAPKTGDVGMALYAALTALSLTGLGFVKKRK